MASSQVTVRVYFRLHAKAIWFPVMLIASLFRTLPPLWMLGRIEVR